MAGIVVVFDFDRTIIDGDSDSWIVTEMDLTQLFDLLRSTLPWNSLMDRMMKELHSRGKTTEDISECLKRAPMDPHIVAAIQSAHALGCDLKIMSDANHFFIEKILEHHGLLGCFSQIITNPTFVDEEGRLRIFPYHDSSNPHSCDLCPSNLCKGLVIEQIRASTSKNGERRFIYLGDGNGDYCPTLRLHEIDHVMPRKKYPLGKGFVKAHHSLRQKSMNGTMGRSLKEFYFTLSTQPPKEKPSMAASPVSRVHLIT